MKNGWVKHFLNRGFHFRFAVRICEFLEGSAKLHRGADKDD